jgi:hypothetical protein
MDDTRNQSDEALAKPSGRLPDYVKPTDCEEAGVRLAKDVFDRDKNIIESSDEDSDKSFSEDDNVGLGQWRGRKKKDDISSITPSDFIKPKENKTPTDDSTCLGCSPGQGATCTNLHTRKTHQEC